MSDHPHECRSCRRLANSYDADRGYSCTRSDCPAVVEAKAKQQRYSDSQRLAETVRPLLVNQPSSLFTVGELAEFMNRYGDGFVLRAAAIRLGLLAPIEEGTK